MNLCRAYIYPIRPYLTFFTLYSETLLLAPFVISIVFLVDVATILPTMTTVSLLPIEFVFILSSALDDKVTLVMLVLFDTLEASSVKLTDSLGLGCLSGDTIIEARVLSIRTSSGVVVLLVFGGFRIVNFDASLLFKLIEAAETSLLVLLLLRKWR